jgi:hypothetical protein
MLSLLVELMKNMCGFSKEKVIVLEIFNGNVSSVPQNGPGSDPDFQSQLMQLV